MTVKILHTSDWHLGQHFYGQSRRAEHQQFLDWLTELAIKKEVDAIIVAGDIFDIGSPPSYARELYYQFVVKLQATGISVVVLAGNHDSAATLTESKGLLACLNTHVIPGVLSEPSDQVIVISHPKDGKPKAIVCAVPFLRAREIQASVIGQTGQQKQKDLQAAIAEHYDRIHQIALNKQSECSQPVPIIATGHLATIGAKISDSVRDIYIGTLSAFSSKHFPTVDYMALGHIHRYQKVSSDQPIYYCGSPIALSFDEINQQKVVLVANFKAGQLQAVEKVPVPNFQAIHRVVGSFSDIEQQILNLEEEYQGQDNTWLEVVIKHDDYLGDLQPRVQALVKDKPFTVLKIRRYQKRQAQNIGVEVQQTLQELTPQDIFEKRLASQDWGDDQQKLLSHLRKAFAEISNGLD